MVAERIRCPTAFLRCLTQLSTHQLIYRQTQSFSLLNLGILKPRHNAHTISFRYRLILIRRGTRLVAGREEKWRPVGRRSGN